MSRSFRHLSVGLALALMMAFITTSSVLAHERRDLGAYRVVVGWLEEPALLEEQNAVYLSINRISDGTPVEGAQQTVKVAISYAGGTPTSPQAMRARSGMPGQYIMDAIPTKTGEYTFHFTGDIAGQSIDEKFVSGPGRFANIEPKTALMVPDKQPSVGEISQKLDALTAKVDQASAVEPSRPVAQTPESSDSTARMYGVIGMIIGVVGLIVGAAGFMTAQRARSSRPS